MLDLTPKQNKIDSNHEKDRARFCYTEETAKTYFEFKEWIVLSEQLGKQVEEKEKNKDFYNKLAKLKKLTIAQLQKGLALAIEKEGYSNLSFAAPEMDRDVRVAFTAQDTRDNREKYDSMTKFKKTIEKALSNTNWRLMSEGITYRLGVLSGRLRGHESEEDLKKLIKANV